MKWLGKTFVMIVVASACFYGLAWPTNELEPARLITFDDYADTSVWTHVGPPPDGFLLQQLKSGTMHYHYTGWSFLDCRNGTPRIQGREIPPDNVTGLQASMANTTNAVILSPVFTNGIGTIYFEAINGQNPVLVGVEVATNMLCLTSGWPTNLLLDAETADFEYIWQSVTNLELNAQSNYLAPQPHDFVRYAETLNWRKPAKMRIRRLDSLPEFIYDSNFAAFDNIRISPPPADVVVRKAECVLHPGHPSINSNLMIRCYVDNVDTNAMTDSRTVRVHYRWRYLDQVVNAWASQLMTAMDTGEAFGNNQRFEGIIPAQANVGDLEYYFTCEFDGYRYQSPDYTGLGYSYPSEWLSPFHLRGGTAETGGREFYARLRRYASQYGTIYVVTEPNNELFEMTQVGEHEWRGMVPVRGQGVTNLTWHFRGENIYAQGLDYFTDDVVHWAQDFQPGAGRLPYGGRCVETNSSGRCSVLVDSTGYVRLTFNTLTLDYMACRAECQDFNAWPAPSEFFSESNGQDPRLRLVNIFDGWPTNETERKYEYFVGYPATTNQYWGDPQTTMGGWVAGNAAYVQERIKADINNRPPGLNDWRNLALRLSGHRRDTEGLGYIYNTVATRTDGLKDISFKCRLGQHYDPIYTVYNLNFMRTNYLVRVNVRLDSAAAPETPSVSLIAYYTGPGNFYEYRITQIPRTGNLDADNMLQHELYKWRGGEMTLLKTATRTGQKLSVSTDAEIRLFTSSAGEVTIRCKYATSDISQLNYSDSNLPHKWGSYGFLSSDGQACFSNVRTQPTSTGAAGTGTTTTELGTSANVFDQQLEMFAVPNERYEGSRDKTPYGIWSVVPPTKLGVYLHPSDLQSDDPPSAPGTLAWQLQTNITVSSFGYESNTVSLNTWRADYVMLKVGKGGADVAVDDLQVFSWHGRRLSDSGMALTRDWVADEAWVVSVPEPGLSEGRFSGSFNTAASSPLTDVQLSARLADTTDGWVTNSTMLYKGMIYLDGAGTTNTFAERFDGKVLLKIDGEEVLNDIEPDAESVRTIVRNTGWYGFELRLGRGVSEAGGPFDGGVGGYGYGVAYSRNGGVSWSALRDTGTAKFLRANGHRVQLDHSRGDPAKAQAIKSPLLTTGMGLMEFDYKVLRGPAKLTVQYALETSHDVWHDIKSVEVPDTAAMSGFEHVSVYLGNFAAGYLRVLNARQGVYSNSLVEIKEAVVWDEPYVSDTSWRVYNAKVTERDRQRIMLDETKACFLNNSQTDEASPIQDLDVPSVKTPLLYKGVGGLSFMARAYTNQTASLYVFASTNGWNAPPDDWKLIHSFTNINNLLYEPYNLELLDGANYDALRLSTGLGQQRVCLEDIVVNEPVFPSFEIMGVTPLCKDITGEYLDTEERTQPMEAESFGIEARIGNMLLTPSNILMYVSYYVGTNVWGVNNWPAGEVVTKPMSPISPGSLVYRTDPSNDLPGQECDQVVQYQVWATYTGGIPLEQRQDSFENPPWYYPVDLNARYAAQGWSPYVIIYDLPIGAVFVNEINVTDYVVVDGDQQHGVWDYQYLEIAVPAGYDLAGWHIDFVRTDWSVQTIRLPANLPLQVEATNGYAFFVLADSQAVLPKLDYGHPSFTISQYFQTYSPGGIRLRRPMGMYEHVFSYDWDRTKGPYYDGAMWALEDPQKKMVLAGQEHNGGSLGVTNAYGKVTADWHFPGYWTPGEPNENQIVPQAAELLPGFSNVLITATMNSEKATQNGFRNPSLIFKVRQGSSTNITYVVDDWYRLKSLKVNGLEQLIGGDWPQSTYDLQLSNISTNTLVQAQIGLRSDIAALGLWPEVLSWLLGFPDGELVPSYYYGRELTLIELFWLNADPTVSHNLEGGIVRVERDPATNYILTVWLALDGQNCTMLQGDSVFKVEAKKGLIDPEWTMVAQYAFSSNSFDANHQSRIFTSNLWYELRGILSTDLFFRWVIEMEDPRIDVWELNDMSDDD